MKETIIGVICKQLSVEGGNVGPESVLEDLGMDSIDIVEVEFTLEDKFSIEISDDEVNKWRTVQDVIDCVERVKG